MNELRKIAGCTRRVAGPLAIVVFGLYGLLGPFSLHGFGIAVLFWLFFTVAFGLAGWAESGKNIPPESGFTDVV